MGSYGHDLYGAQQRGYARRTREAVVTALDNAQGWADPQDPTGAHSRRGWRLALDVLLTEAKRRGVTEDAITKALDLRKARPGTFGDPGKDRDRRIAREDRPYSEDPSKGMDAAALRAYLDGIRNPEELRRMVMEERAIRLSAQQEAGID